MNLSSRLATIDLPTANESGDGYLQRMGIPHFSWDELLWMKRLGVKVPEPPRKLWHHIIPTLWVAEELRDMVDHPLALGNGYRPEPFNSRAGGASRSPHIKFFALDIDLPKKYSTRHHQEELYEATCILWTKYGREYKMGIGLYRPWRGKRVHIDTWKYRCWKRKYVNPIVRATR